MTQISEELIMKFIANRCSDEELRMVKQWMDESDDNVRQIFEIEKTAMLAGCLKSDETEHDRMWDSVNQKIADDKMRQERYRRFKVYRWSAAAAILTGIILCATFLFRQPKVEMINVTAENGCMTITLPDSTKVWLNQNASISYPALFADNRRKVVINGEVYFEVSRDTSCPFTAESDWLNVTVLGTKFNFNSSSDKECSVSLLEGKVEVKPNDNTDGVVLSPGQKVKYNPRSGQMSIVQANTKLDAVWHDRLIHFNNSNIQEIASDLEELYNVDITIRPSIDKSRTYSGETIFYESLDSTLSALSKTLPLNYSRHGQSVILTAK